MNRPTNNQATPYRFAAATFWAAFFLLNTIFFTPLTILFRRAEIAPADTSLWYTLFVERPGYDVFRINVEWVVLLALWVIFGRNASKRARLLIWAAYALIASYSLYAGIIFGVFSNDPILYNDYFLAREGALGLIEHFQFPRALLVGAALFPFLLLLLLLLVTSKRITSGLGRLSRGVLLSLALLTVGSVLLDRERSASPNSVVSSMLTSAWGNWQRSSSSYTHVQEAEELFIENNPYDFSQFELDKRPSVYLIFVESYGDVLYSNNALTDPYTSLLIELEGSLRDEGWEMASSSSQSPTFGGASWLGYSSLLHGLPIDSVPIFEALVRLAEESPPTSLSRFLQSQGYQYNRITPLRHDNERERRLLKSLDMLYGHDRWLMANDYEYAGLRYGWGISPPDQYSLGLLREMAISAETPTINFFITHNSHAPWGEQPELVDEWRSLNSGTAAVVDDPESGDFSAESYMAAIEYQMRTVVDFIQREPEDDTIFVVLGDHQPGGGLATRDSFYTPLHVISRNRDFISDFHTYEFADSLTTSNRAPDLRHEGFLSLFMRTLLDNYSNTPDEGLPTYWPDGMPPER